MNVNEMYSWYVGKCGSDPFTKVEFPNELPQKCSVCNQNRLLKQFLQVKGGMRGTVCAMCGKTARRKLRKQLRSKPIKKQKQTKSPLVAPTVKTEVGDTFKSRDVILEQLGYKNYKTYLRSKTWKNVKKQSFKEKGVDCVLCGKWADVIHHRKYDKSTLLGENLEWLVPLCNACHTRIEFINGKKTNHAKSEQLFCEYIEEYKQQRSK